jgi:hypothetical protein
MTPEEAQWWYEGTFWDEIWRVDGRDDAHRHDANMFGVSWHGIDWDSVSWTQERPHILTSHREVVSSQNVSIRREVFESRGIDPLDLPPAGVTLNNITGDARVDAYGNLLDIEISATVTVEDVFGDTHVANIYFEMRFTDIGTSNPTSPIVGAEQILTYDYLRARFGTAQFSRWSSVFFTLNADGSINMDSLTTSWPGGIG